jgi:outer membrane biosynthesis protein TonB
VRSLRVLDSTGYPLYDERLTSRMQSWRYRPYQLASGAAVPVCTSVTFVYRIR